MLGCVETGLKSGEEELSEGLSHAEGVEAESLPYLDDGAVGIGTLPFAEIAAPIAIFAWIMRPTELGNDDCPASSGCQAPVDKFSPAPMWSPDSPPYGGGGGGGGGGGTGFTVPVYAPPPPPQDCYACPEATCTPRRTPESLLDEAVVTRTNALPDIEKLFKEGLAFYEGNGSPSPSGTTGTTVAPGENGATDNGSDTDLIKYLHSLLTDFQPPTPGPADPGTGDGTTVPSSSGPTNGNGPTVAPPVSGPKIPQGNPVGAASPTNSGVTEDAATPQTATGGASMGGGNPPATGIGACQPDPTNGAGGPSYRKLVSQGANDAHHIIQHAAVRELSGYSKYLAPAIQLVGPSTQAGTPHALATAVQRLAGGGTYGAEREIGYNALRAAGLSHSDASSAIERADQYFMGSLCMGLDTPTRIPGRRAR